MEKSIVIVTYYGFKTPILEAVTCLQQRGFLVNDFSMFRYKHDCYDKVSNYMDMFFQVLSTTKPKIILFWFTGIDEAEFCELKSFCKSNLTEMPKFILYTWDDPYNWRTNQSLVPKFAPYLDCALTCCAGSIKDYEKANPLCDARLLYPGFDKILAQKMVLSFCGPDRFVCDVSFLCTNLYLCEKTFPDQKIRRALLLDAIEARSDICFHLYGPEHLRDRYPRSYKGFVNYEKQYEIARTSRISLSTHVVSNDNTLDYLNERCIIIMGCGGLLLSDNKVNAKIISTKEEIYENVFYETGDSVESTIYTIDTILKFDYEKTEKIRENAQRFASQYLTWDSWAASVEDIAKTCVASSITLQPRLKIHSRKKKQICDLLSRRL